MLKCGFQVDSEQTTNRGGVGGGGGGGGDTGRSEVARYGSGRGGVQGGERDNAGGETVLWPALCSVSSTG